MHRRPLFFLRLQMLFVCLQTLVSWRTFAQKQKRQCGLRGRLVSVRPVVTQGGLRGRLVSVQPVVAEGGLRGRLVSVRPVVAEGGPHGRLVSVWPVVTQGGLRGRPVSVRPVVAQGGLRGSDLVTWTHRCPCCTRTERMDFVFHRQMGCDSSSPRLCYAQYQHAQELLNCHLYTEATRERTDNKSYHSIIIFFLPLTRFCLHAQCHKLGQLSRIDNAFFSDFV